MLSYSTRAQRAIQILALLKCLVLHALRDANEHQVTVGVGKAGELFKPSRDAEDNSSVTGTPEFSKAVITDEEEDVPPQVFTQPRERAIDPLVLDTRWLAHKSSYLYQDLWAYNPFRAYYAHHTQTLKDDTECPKAEDWRESLGSLTPGEVAMCVLKYIVAYRCKIPFDTCVSCPCPEEPQECLVEQCYASLPFLFAKYYIGIPIAIVFIHLMLSPVLNSFFKWLMRYSRFERFIARYIGTKDKSPTRPGFCTYLLVVQIFASGLNVVLYTILGVLRAPLFPWVRSNLGEIPDWTGWAQFVLNIQMLVNYYVNLSKSRFSWQAVLTPDALIDVFTAHQTMAEKILYDNKLLWGDGRHGFHGDPDMDFLAYARPDMHLHFLRSYRCLTALLQLGEMGALGKFSAIKQQLMKTGLRLWALVICATGFFQLAEWMGHDFHLNKFQGGRKNVGECQSKLEMHDNIACIPFFVGTYWIFTSMTSVGYGDYRPSSSFAYILVIFVMVFGIVYLIVESSIVKNVIVAEKRGTRETSAAPKHVIITGGAVRDVDQNMLVSFISQLFHPSVTEEGCAWPELVILGNVQNPEALNKILEKRVSGQLRSRITFCNGDPLKLTGLAQAKVTAASFVFILPSSKAEDLGIEDEFNIHAALSVKTVTSVDTTHVVVVFQPTSLKVAVLGGLHPGQVCCLNKMRTSIMAKSVRVRGWPLMLTIMTNSASYQAEGGQEFCKANLLPDDYLSSCANSVWGFALAKYAAGRSFKEFAAEMYQATGALPICAQIQKTGRIECFPASRVLDPDTVVFCLNRVEPSTNPAMEKFLSSQFDWQTQFQKNRAEGHQTSLSSLEELVKYIREVPDAYNSEPLSADSMEQMRLKAEIITDNKDQEFALAVMTRSGNIWPVITMFVDKFPLAGRNQCTTLDRMGLIFLVPEPPPQEVVDHLGALDRDVQLAFVVDEWARPEVLVRYGAQKCKALICLPTKSLRSEPSNDSKTFVLLRLLKRMGMRTDCFILTELTSGMKGAHMIPPPSKMTEEGEEPIQPPLQLMEDLFNPACAAGSVFVPGALIGTIARSYYTPGILEVAQVLTDNIESGDDDTMHVEQIGLPPGYFGKTYKHLVLDFLFGRIGPDPCLVLGLLRKTLYSEAVMINPVQQLYLESGDLVILMMSRKAAEWTQEQGLHRLGGRHFVDV